jgi:four helix bundle protein
MRVISALPDSAQGRIISHQLMKAGSSVGANYRAVCRARTRKDFINKLGVVIEEADESAFWLEVSGEGNVLDPQQLAPAVARIE